MPAEPGGGCIAVAARFADDFHRPRRLPGKQGVANGNTASAAKARPLRVLMSAAWADETGGLVGSEGNLLQGRLTRNRGFEI
jgi:hypothetical protein